MKNNLLQLFNIAEFSLGFFMIKKWKITNILPWFFLRLKIKEKENKHGMFFLADGKSYL